MVEEAAERGLDSVDDAYVGYTWVLLDLFDGDYEAALARLSSGSSTAFSTHCSVPSASRTPGWGSRKRRSVKERGASICFR